MDEQVSYPDYITPDIKALIGREAQIEAWDEVERVAIRRLVQAVMNPDPVYWDDGYAAKTRYRGVVAPPMYPMYAFRFPPNAADPLDAACGGGALRRADCRRPRYMAGRNPAHCMRGALLRSVVLSVPDERAVPSGPRGPRRT